MPTVDPILNDLANEHASSIEWIAATGAQLSVESSTQTLLEDRSFYRKFIDKVSLFFAKINVRSFTKKKIDPTPAAQVFAEHNFGETRKWEASTPPGFSGRYLDFLSHIRGNMPIISSLPEALTLMIKTLAILINEPDRARAQTGLQDVGKQLRLANDNELVDLKKFFQTNSRIVARFGDVVDNNGEFLKAIDECNWLNEHIGAVDYSKTVQQINRVAELAKTLNDKLLADREQEVSGYAASQLSDIFFQMGVTVTYVVTVLETMTQMTEALATTVNNIPSNVAQTA